MNTSLPFSKKVKYLRFQLKISQAALAKEIGVSVPTISRWERGGQEPRIMAPGSFYEFRERQGIDFKEAKGKWLRE